MAELNDKLITYGNLSTFYNKLQEQGCIEEVSVLPEASENKDKLVRLTSDKKVYAPNDNITTVTTDRLPDDEQIDKAYLYESGTIYYYKGEVTVVLSDGQLTWYKWYDSEQPEYLYITEADAENISNSNLCAGISTDDGWVFSENTVTYENETISSFISGWTSTINDNGMCAIPATYNAPESAQIGNAYLNDGDNCYYNGVEYTLNYTDGVSIKAYGWVYEGDTSPSLYTPKKASEIYYQNTYDVQGYITGKYTDAIGYFIDTSEYPIVNNTITLDYPSSEEENAIGDYQILYIPQLNAPDSEQVGNAYLVENYIGSNSSFVYTGEETTIEVDGNNVTVYTWFNDDFGSYFSTKRAYEIYNTDKDLNSIHFYVDEAGEISEVTFEYGDLISISTVKYQRTETTETWAWDKIAYGDLNSKQDVLIAGQNINISEDTISAIGYTYNSNSNSFAEGANTTASGSYSHAEGNNTTASGSYSHAEGNRTTASGVISHAEGNSTIASGNRSHAEGNNTTASGNNSHAEGAFTFASNDCSHAEGNRTTASGNYSHAEGQGQLYQAGGVTFSSVANSEILNCVVIGTTISNKIKIGEILVYNDIYRKVVNVDDGDNTVEIESPFTEQTIPSGTPMKYYSGIAWGDNSHAEGYDNTASGNNSHAEGLATIASGLHSHAEGEGTVASGNRSHAEGEGTVASGNRSHAEGLATIASGNSSHAEGERTIASGIQSHTEGNNNIAQNFTEHAEGRYNISHKASDTYGNAGNTQHSVGVNNKNAFEIMQNGDVYVYGIGGYQGTDTTVQDATIQTLQAYIASLEARIAALENPSA